MNNDIAKDAARIKRLAEGAALAILTADNDSSFSAAEVEAVARPIRETLEAATAADKERIANLDAWQADVQEREGACCPEDVGFDEYIGRLERRLAAKTQECEGLREDKARLDWLNREAGFFQDDSATKISIHPDDATCTWHIEIGSTKGYSRSIRGAIDAARREVKE